MPPRPQPAHRRSW